MIGADPTLLAFARQLLLVLDPLRRGFTSTEQFRALLYRLGWNAGNLPNEYVNIGASITDAVATVQGMASGPFEPARIGQLLGKAKIVYDNVYAGLPPPTGVDPERFAAEISEHLVDLLLIQYLSREWPQVYALLLALEVIQTENLGAEPQTGDPARPNKSGYVRAFIVWDEIPNILKDPHLILQRVYGWGTDELKTPVIMHHLATFLYGLGFPISISGVDDRTIDAYAGIITSFSGTGRERGLKFPFHYDYIAGTPVELSFQLLPLPANAGLKPGLVIQPGFPSDIPITVPLSDDTTLSITFGSDIGAQFGVLIRPEGLSFKYPFSEEAATPSVTLGISVAKNAPEPVTLLGDPTATRLQFKGFTIGLKATGPVDDIELVLSADVHELSVVLAAGEGDGFLQTILGDGETRIDVPLGIDWSSKHGFGFRGSLNFEVQLHPHLEIGPLKIPDLRLSLTITPDTPAKARIEGVITLEGQLGPLAFVAEGIGIQALFDFRRGNLGPMDLQLGFRPPNGVGLSIDAGAVSGGGYLFFDHGREEYAGVLQLSILDMLTVTAIGMITTRMPDGSQGFSFLAIMNVEFTPGIQLGFGFTLTGLGGIVGLNRTMVQEALLAGAINGTLSNIMFPSGDIIAQAPRIISDLRTIFPPEEGTFLIGPMAKIGWGTPSLLTISVGVIIEGSEKVAIIGLLLLALPTVDAPLIKIQVGFIGVIEFDRQRMYFRADLFDSRILFMTLEGRIGLLMAWGDDANFVLTVGGFHPRFDPPALPFGEVQRLSLSILNEAYARIRVEAYFAVTSNTVQFGANAQLYFGFSSLSIEGYIGFDALFQFSPFHFIIDVRAGFSLVVFGFDTLGIHVSFTLEGPAPWRARGTGTISILFWDFSVDFDKTWGEEADTVLPPVAVLPLLQAELGKLENWKTALPPSSNLLVSLRERNGGDTDLVIHPIGMLSFTQRLLPLGIDLDKLGTQTPSDARHFELLPAGSLVNKGDSEERFAMAQYVNMDDAEKLSRPSFERGKGGIDMGVATDLRADHAACRTMRYEELWIDNEYKEHQRFTKGFDHGLFTHFIGGAAVANNVLSGKNKGRFDPYTDKITVADMGYAVAHADTNSLYAGSATFRNKVEADAFLRRAVAADATLAGQLAVIPEMELMN
ncbi:MAG: DUF6603 domain-containing protein [Flavobacteriales bacterium]